MTVPQALDLEKIQRCANDISARLAKAFKQPSELLGYLRTHAECLKDTLSPRGYAYYVNNAGAPQELLAAHTKDLLLAENPGQMDAFRKAVVQTFQQGAPTMIPPNTLPVEALHGLQAEDSPMPEQLPIFNQTPFQQFFIPIPAAESVFGVLQIWFTTADAPTTQFRLGVLQHACGEIQLYLKARQVIDVSRELARVHGYSRLLEAFAGDFELQSVADQLAEYAREAVKCDRVTVFAANNYQKRGDATHRAFKRLSYAQVAASGHKCPRPGTDAAAWIQGAGSELLIETVVPMADAHRATELSRKTGPQGQPQQGGLRPAPPGERVPVRFVWLKRDAAENADGPIQTEAKRNYLEGIPMNWATVLPLLDKDLCVCGYVMFEGKTQPEESTSALLQLQDLAYSAGHALSTALFWDGRKSLQVARRWVTWFDGFANTPRKRKWVRILAPICAILVVLLFPTKFSIKGDATLRPEKILQYPAELVARIVEVSVREGDTVSEGDPLVKLETRELELQLQEQESEYLSAITEADRAQGAGDENAMHAARLEARKAAATIQALRQQLERAHVVAPFDGLILGPKNIHQNQGKVAQVGETLIEVASPDAWEVKIKLKEQDLVFLEDLLKDRGTLPGSLKLTADPEDVYPIAINDPRELAHGLEVDLAESEYHFLAIVPLEASSEMRTFFKAGFGGQAKFPVGYRPLAYVLLRDVFLYIRVHWL